MNPGSAFAIIMSRWSVHLVKEKFWSYRPSVKTMANGNSLSLSVPK